MKVLSWTTQVLGGALLLGLIAGLIYALVTVLRIVTYEQVDDEDHLARKAEYLAEIAQSEATTSSLQSGAKKRPNLLVILFDDLGYGDLGAYGAKSIATPRIDQLASEGLRFDNYYAPSSVCTSSRAALLTGRYAPRAGLTVIAFPTGHLIDNFTRASGEHVRLPAEEILLPEILSAAGYDTGMVGKWHLGDHAPSLPHLRGFDSYFGALFSNDMTPFALYRNEEVAWDAPFDQTELNEVYTEAAIEFLDRDRDAPFFLYYAHNFPHIPLYTPSKDQGRSQAGLYGDVVEGLDDSVGAILDVLERRGQLDNTLVLITSDNGPWYEGNPGAVRGRKNQTWEGGVRVPLIAHWPAEIEAGRNSQVPVVGVDLLPTILSLLDLPTPTDRMLDGVDVAPLLMGENEVEDRLIYYFSANGGGLDAVRDARFKYHRRRGVRTGDWGETFSFRVPQGPWLFDLENDPAESYDATQRYPAVAERMASHFTAKRSEMEDNPRGWR